MDVNRLVAVLAFFFLWTSALAQKNRYMVFFKDKASSPYQIENPQEFLSQKAIDRRIRHGFAVTEADVPVNANYIHGIDQAGAEVYFSTRWMNGILVQCEPALLPVITSLPYVQSVKLVGHDASLISGGRIKSPSKDKSAKTKQLTDTQLQMIGIDKMHSEGIKGDGVTIAVLDAGFPGVNTAEPFLHLTTNGQIDQSLSKDFVYNSGNVFQFNAHGTEVLSVIGAVKNGTFSGGAPNARFQLYVTEEVPTEYRIEEYNWLFAAERADSSGVDVIQSSLGYYDFDDNSMDYLKTQMDGKTAIVTKAAQMASDRGIVVVVSAGNEGNNSWQVITAPADAADVLAVGSVSEQLVKSNSSSIGPTADLRIKPDVAALGVNTSVIMPNGSEDEASGTSLAAPLITSLAAGLLQKFPFLTNRQIMDAIRKSGSLASNPNNLLGYGIPNYESAVKIIESEMEKDLFEIFPNPSLLDSLKIKCNHPEQVKNCTIDFISAEGKFVYSTQAEFSAANLETTISTAPLAAGLYIVRITWDDKFYHFRFVKA